MKDSEIRNIPTGREDSIGGKSGAGRRPMINVSSVDI